MKFAVALYHGEFEKSAFEKTQKWISALDTNLEYFEIQKSTVTELLENLIAGTENQNAESVIYTWSDCPFLDLELTKELCHQHEKYGAEYTFADGYPYGITPEIIHLGTLKILLQLSKQNPDLGEGKVSRTSIFDLIKKDINSFEIETLISDKDFRLSRLEFASGSKFGKILCERFEKLIEAEEKKLGKTLCATEKCELAEKSPEILQVLPGFYNLQIASSCHGSCDYCPYPNACKNHFGKNPAEITKNDSFAFMDFSNFQKFLEKANNFSDKAVISLSLWGEPLLHLDFPKFVKAILENPKFSVLIETSGENLSLELIKEISEIKKSSKPRENQYPPVIWILSFDAGTENLYKVLHPNSKKTYSELLEFSSILETEFPEEQGVKAVYKQFVRLTENECELEQFFRGNKNPLIQKYDNFQNRLPNRKPADLTPINRYPCWHLRRDISVLIDGSVPLCRENLFENILGNVFTDSLEEIFEKLKNPLIEQINCEYKGLCANCDEYYTFNF